MQRMRPTPMVWAVSRSSFSGQFPTLKTCWHHWRQQFVTVLFPQSLARVTWMTTWEMRRIMHLPTHLGGPGLEYPAFRNVCHPIADLILQQSGQLNQGTLDKSKDRQGQQLGKRRDNQQWRTPGCSWKSSLMTPNEWSTWLLKGCIQLAGGLACRWAWLLPAQDGIQGCYLPKA